MMETMGEHGGRDGRQAADVLALYDSSLATVYGYLARRCGSPTLAEDLTAETFLAAVAAVSTQVDRPPLTVAWLLTVARNKLVDHWRRQEQELRRLGLVTAASDQDVPEPEEPFDPETARAALAQLGPAHRGALTLRYLDGLGIPEVAEAMGRTPGATEVLLVRARRAFRSVYLRLEEEGR